MSVCVCVSLCVCVCVFVCVCVCVRVTCCISTDVREKSSVGRRERVWEEGREIGRELNRPFI